MSADQPLYPNGRKKVVWPSARRDRGLNAVESIPAYPSPRVPACLGASELGGGNWANDGMGAAA